MNRFPFKYLPFVWESHAIRARGLSRSWLLLVALVYLLFAFAGHHLASVAYSRVENPVSWGYLAFVVAVVAMAPPAAMAVLRLVAPAPGQGVRSLSARLSAGIRADVDESRLAAWLFTRAIALCYLIAFLSMWSQIHALVGEQGIVPVNEVLPFLQERQGEQYWLQTPTLLWMSPTDGGITAVLVLGVAASFALLFDVFPRLSVAVAWLAYLSLVWGGSYFFLFQWDLLLLECGLAVFLMGPGNIKPRWPSRLERPNAGGLWFARLLLFKLMFLSGLTKLIGADPLWHDLSALTVHHLTTPLPTILGYYAHSLPPSIHAASTLIMFWLEIVAPLALLGTRRFRTVAGVATIALMLGICATGNYGFFNFLTIALALVAIPDGALSWLRLPHEPARVEQPHGTNEWRVALRWTGRLALGIAAAWFCLISISHITRHVMPDHEPELLTRLRGVGGGWRTVNSYGLFVNMTEQRPEVIVEGSMDGRTWKAYEFVHKPGRLDRAPTWSQPHMPRLDWQMWFAALSSPRRQPWFHRFMRALLEGNEKVLGLLEHNPFPQTPPKYVRARRFEYFYTEPGEGEDYWRRELMTERYFPVVSLDSFR